MAPPLDRMDVVSKLIARLAGIGVRSPALSAVEAPSENAGAARSRA
jgi:hypothetical protein